MLINLHMSDIFRIFVTEKEIVIRIFTIKTPRRWAKRQTIMRKLNFKENTIKDLGTLNRGQSMLLNLYFKGYTDVELGIYRRRIELNVYNLGIGDLTAAEMIIRDQMADGDTIEKKNIEDPKGPFQILEWRGHLLETEDKENDD